MQTFWKALGVIAAVAVAAFLVDWSTYRNMNGLKNEAAAKLKDIAAFEMQRSGVVALQLPLLEAQLKQEHKVHVKGVAEAYKAMGQVTIGAGATAEDMQRFVEAKNKAGATLSGLASFLVANYPVLAGSSEAGKIIMIEAAGSQRKITVGYTDYNDTSRKYENWRTGYFTSFSAKRHGFGPLPEIAISADERKMPDTTPKMN